MPTALFLIMGYENKKVAGFLLLVGAVQFVLGMIVSEALYPGYSTSGNYISDLGVGESALIFNSSIILLGVFIVAGAYFVLRAFNSKVFSLLLAITGIGAIGVGIFTEHFGIAHTVFSLITFLFAGISIIVSSKFERPPLSYLSIILGAASLVSLVLFGTGVDLGLGKGGMERMIAYPVLLGAIGLGGYFIGDSKDGK
ncbi:MAG: DUF998 domain-containing protein [Candidatus Bathyarchaeota archaeon]|nr:DUF998 domain-containing protein [Candidatus Bathyarchaeota archaeon]